MDYFDSSGQLIAIHINDISNFKESKFFTNISEELQVGLLLFSKDKVVKNHIHHPKNRSIKKTSEVLYVLTGSVNVSLFDYEKKLITKFVAYHDSVLIFLSGGHGLDFSETTKLLEIKQGPYSAENDKEKF